MHGLTFLVGIRGIAGEFCNAEPLVLKVLCQLLHLRRHHLAGAAPCGQVVDHQQLVVGMRLGKQCLEVRTVSQGQDLQTGKGLGRLLRRPAQHPPTTSAVEAAHLHENDFSQPVQATQGNLSHSAIQPATGLQTCP